MKKLIVKTSQLTLLLAITTLGFTSCDKDEVIPETTPVVVKTGAVFVSNEGGFLKNEAAVSFINLDNNEVIADVYQSNNSEILGDVAQSITAVNGKVYVVVNNSAKAVIINPTTFKKEGEITGLGSPNYMAAGDATHAYISDLFGGPISVINTTSNTVEKTIDCPGSTVEMLSLNGKTYVTNNSSEYLYVISHSTNTITDSILVGKGAQSIQVDKNGNLWLGCSALYDDNWQIVENGKIKQVSITSKTVLLNLTVGAGGVKKIRMNSSKNQFVYLNGKVFKMNITDNSLPTAVFFEKENANLNGLGVDPITNTVYVADAKDYSSNGAVYQLDFSGSKTNEYEVSKVPGEFYFLSK